MIRKSTFLERTAAWTVDVSIFIFLWSIITNNIINKYDIQAKDMLDYFNIVIKLNNEILLLTSLFFVLYFVYIIYMEKYYSMTIGKFIFSLKIEYKTKDGYVKLNDVLLRLLGCCLSWICFNVGHLYMRYDKEKITLYDKLTNIHVMYNSNIMLGSAKPINYNLSLKLQKIMIALLILLIIIFSYVMFKYVYVAIVKGFYLYYF